MTDYDLSKVKRELAERRALRRWVAAIREALLRQFNHPDKRVAVIERDLNQCERLLMTSGIDNDPVIEIWRKDGERAGVRWFDFDPEMKK